MTVSGMAPPAVPTVAVATVVAFGLRMVTVVCVIVTALMLSPTRWPATASKTTRPICPAVPRVAVLASPRAMRPVNPTSVVAYGGGGMKRSVALVPLPAGVATFRRPDAVPPGTWIPIVVEVAVSTRTPVTFAVTRFDVRVDSKLVPVIETVVPATATPGVKLVMVGTPPLLTTVNDMALVAEPKGVVTPIGPVVAPAGTVTMRRFDEAEVTVAATPLNVTVFWPGVAL
jgi:hypothetical protein